MMTLAALNGLVAVALGAFGAHGLKQRVAADLLVIFETGARYHMTHALALLGAGLLALHHASATLQAAAIAFCVGILLFSGSLYLLALSGVRWLGAITPLGGLAFLIGWSLFAWSAWRDLAG
jgi:uncharacterized membrane protein YgdD (TMEM256/DUF423 family)